MKRKTKNIIMTVILVLLIACVGVTMYLAKSSSAITLGESNMNSQMPSDSANSQNNNQDSNSNNNSSNNQDSNSNSNSDTQNNSNSEPPAKPEDNNSNNNSNGEPPAKPEDNNSNESSETDNVDNNSNSQDNSNGSQNNNMAAPPTMNNESKTDVIYYILYGVEGLGISTIVIYLILSGFNKKTFKETFCNKDKVVIYVLSVVVLTGINAFGLSKANDYLNSDNKTTQSTSSNVEYSASKEITEDIDIDSGSYSSSNKDENAISVSNSKSNISNVTVIKTGDSDSGDNSNFYGNNSAILAKDGAVVSLKNITVTTKANGANGVFSYGGSATTNNTSSDGTTVKISNSKITTTGDNAGGIMTTGGGVMKATNLTINTSGISSAAIRTDRGGGTVTVNKGTYTTTGQGSPAIYSTADVTVSNAKLISKASEGVVIEGKNKVTLNNCTLTDTNNKLNGKSTTYKNIFIYQSMSGDASEGTAEFTAKNSKITTNKGDTLYVTNTKAKINLENNTIKNTDSSGNFLRIQKDSWGNSGSNGGDVTLNMTNQKASGNTIVDSISTLTMNLNKSTYEGTINGDNSAKSITLKLDKSSKIKLTGDSYVTSLEDDDSDYSNIDFNGYKLYVNGKAIN